MMSVKNYAFRFRGKGSHLGFYGLAKVHVNNGHENGRGLPKQVFPKNCVIMTNGEKCILIFAASIWEVKAWQTKDVIQQ